mgnify:CR=1 FL=1
MIRKSIINRINRHAKNRGLKVTEIKEIKFITSNGNSWLFCEMDCNKRHQFIV